MACIRTVEQALDADAARQQYKYGNSEPCAGAARYHFETPRGVHNTKYSERLGVDRSILNKKGDDDDAFGDSESEEDNDLSSTRAAEVVNKHRFNIRTLRGWFKDIDMKRTGSISQRELIVALRQHKGMQALFCAVQGVEMGDDEAARGVEQVVRARREEVQRIKRILDDIDTDGSGTMEWREFVEFFRRAGLFLEYRTRQSLNRCSVVEPFVQAEYDAANTVVSDRNRRAQGLPPSPAVQKSPMKLQRTMTMKDLADELEEMFSKTN